MTFCPDTATPADGRFVIYVLDEGGNPQRAAASLGLVQGNWDRMWVARPVDGRVVAADVPVWAVPLRTALPALLALPIHLDDAPTWRRPSASVTVWALAARTAVRLVSGHHLAPTLVTVRGPGGTPPMPEVGSGGTPPRIEVGHGGTLPMTDPAGQVHGVWRALVENAEAGGLLARLAAAMPRAGHALVCGDAGGGPASTNGAKVAGTKVAGTFVWEPAALLRSLLDAVADLAVRDGGPAPPTGRPRARLLPWTARWAEALADPQNSVVPLREDAAELVASVGGWHTGAKEDGGVGTTELQLRAPNTHDGVWRLEFGVRTPDGELHPAADVWATPTSEHGVPALQETLLRGLGRCARMFPPIDAVLREPAPERLDLDLDQAWQLLSEASPLLAGVGVVVRLPGELVRDRLRPRIRVGVGGTGEPRHAEPYSPFNADEPREGVRGDAPDARSGVRGDAPDARSGVRGDAPDNEEHDLALLPGIRAGGGSGGHPAFTGLLTGFRWEIALGDETLSAQEFEAIVAAKVPLVRWRDRWVRVDPGWSERIGRLGEVGELSVAEALALSLERDAAADLYADGQGFGDAPIGQGFGDALADGDAEPIEIVADGGVALLLDRIRAACDHPPAPKTPEGFVGELRGYQRRGVAWLEGMGELGLGAVLADDMGLGKTIQLIAHLLERPVEGPFLIVCPTSVVGNWEREVRRFAPGMPVARHHGADRPRVLGSPVPAGAVLTTYGTLRRDADLLAAVDWDVVALDEAQYVKNPTTAAARAVRRLRARQVVALTGTPLENRLAELWSVLDATNPGLLGTRASFGRRFVAPIEKRRDGAAAARLRRLVAPFVLRRSKADPAVIADLPSKIERTVICPLTAEQAALYQAAVDHTLAMLAGAGTIQRRGRILALLTKLKQICNHPAQYLDEAAPRLPGRAGKLAAAQEIVAEATNAGDRLLVFTQFVAMGRLLTAQLSCDLGVDVPFLHGGVAAGQRDRMVERFQSDPDASPVLIVSLRAGGTGLNLTAATHVIHYDRWWNPAVEDQATDRAHRIGQTRTVEVHKLVTAGTLEERIAELLERKRALADAVVGAGETWVTELDNEALADLVALSRDASIVDLDDDEEPIGMG
ncbi:MAG: DEAD/DEAH box helicase, partial [Egibacteraceae bacterium]